MRRLSLKHNQLKIFALFVKITTLREGPNKWTDWVQTNLE